MTKKQNTLYGILGLLVGIIGGIAGTAYAMGAEQQRVKDALASHQAEIVAIKASQEEHRDSVENEMDRYAEIIAAQMTQLQSSIGVLTDVVANLRTDVQVLKALMERLEEDIKSPSSSGG